MKQPLPACVRGGDGSTWYPLRLWRHAGQVYWIPLYKWYVRGDNGGFAEFKAEEEARAWVEEMTKQNALPTRFITLNNAPYTCNKPYTFSYEYSIMHVERLKNELLSIFECYECEYEEKYLFNCGRGQFTSYAVDIVEELSILRRKYIITSLCVTLSAENIEGNAD